MTNLVPKARVGAPDRWISDSPFFALHREMNRLFDDTFRTLGATQFGAAAGWPSVEVSETDKSVKVTAELAGIDEKDLELHVEDDVLTLKGEKRTETEDKDKHYSEHFYGRFERRLQLPSAVDEKRAEATFKNGVLTVILPKSDRAKDAAKRIVINKA